MPENVIESSLCKEDANFEVPLRPSTLKEFAGQDAIRERLDVVIGAARQRGEAISHCLFSGPPGLGKTTLANILANAIDCDIIVTSGPVLEKAGDLAGMLTNLKKGDILFIDEIHRLNRVIEEYLYSAMEDYCLDLVIDSGPAARSVQLKLEQFTLVGATTRAGALSGPLRSRFPMTFRLDFYSPDVLKTILLRSAKLLGVTIDDISAWEIAARSRGTPRIANNLLRWVRDYAQMKADNIITEDVVKKALEMIAIDEEGFGEMDKKILEIIIDHHNGGPVGLGTIATAIGEEKVTIEEMYEPYLIMKGFLRRTSRGREVTTLAYEHLGKKHDFLL
ncbi:MAG: Holliday junction branch migration DNA helicase RuvB [Waddliaceae bacterium]|jgi:holliday junction DNA helicase RuvB|nr:Holliday junction branch migration DNA helicase RuvB [Waddliaceae bacterium]MBT3579232.1 Holliday junction branch migration DNA helicase RuvB [Waddliaceae bacterium]MBT4444470.1 Holliday junction branch migration DNA helicase RuvB [Waddliaceae bacterium]MBT6928931.1 Holliday junction branch migration DNA helicase RuvB [Waddliaceae bacterium]MBT7264178.1 Holliday junction branch migration DNA helicase RuvB [Waddliaceae bacterium]